MQTQKLTSEQRGLLACDLPLDFLEEGVLACVGGYHVAGKLQGKLLVQGHIGIPGFEPEREPASCETGSPGRGRRTRTLNKGFGDPRVTITPCPYGFAIISKDRAACQPGPGSFARPVHPAGQHRRIAAGPLAGKQESFGKALDKPACSCYFT